MTTTQNDSQFLMDIAGKLAELNSTFATKEAVFRLRDIARRTPSEKPPILVGTPIWRSVITEGHPHNVSLIIRDYTVGSIEVDQQNWNFGLDEKKKDGIIFRAVQDQFSYYKSNLWVAMGPRSRGLVCICDQQPPPDWTHFMVMGLSKKQNVAFVKAVAGPTKDLVAQYAPPNAKFKDAPTPKEAA